VSVSTDYCELIIDIAEKQKRGWGAENAGLENNGLEFDGQENEGQQPRTNAVENHLEVTYLQRNVQCEGPRVQFSP